jgi:protein phosphatase PTC1
MVVKFDNQALRQAFEHKSEAIGVEGDPSSLKVGGISEADAIVKEARKSMGDTGADGNVDEETLHRVSKEIIKEEEEKEAGPEADPEGVRKAAAAAKNKK